MLFLMAAKDKTLSILDPSHHGKDAVATALEVSGVEETMILTFKYVALIFVLLWVVREAKQMIIDEQGLKKGELLRVVGLVIMIVLYVPIVDTLDEGMNIVKDMATFENDDIDIDIERLYNFADANQGFSTIPNPRTTLLSVMIRTLKYLDIGISFAFEAYILINLFFIRIFGPLAIVFSIFPAFGGFFITWLKMYLKYHIYGVVLSIALSLTKNYILFFISDSEGFIITEIGGVGVVSALIGTILTLLVTYIIFKLLVVITSFRMIDNIFGGESIGASGMVKDLVKGGTSIASKKFGK